LGGDLSCQAGYCLGVVLAPCHKVFCSFFAVLGLEFRAYILNHSTSPFFVKDFFKIGAQELFAQAGFEL
jgi:hypothetical protein